MYWYNAMICVMKQEVVNIKTRMFKSCSSEILFTKFDFRCGFARITYIVVIFELKTTQYVCKRLYSKAQFYYFVQLLYFGT